MSEQNLSDYHNLNIQLEGSDKKYYITEFDLEKSLTDRIAELEAQNRWIPVSERLPERQGNTSLGVRYLTLYAGYYHDVCVFLPGDNLWSREGVDKTEYVTHWRPLPQPPEEQE